MNECLWVLFLCCFCPLSFFYSSYSSDVWSICCHLLSSPVPLINLFIPNTIQCLWLPLSRFLYKPCNMVPTMGIQRMSTIRSSIHAVLPVIGWSVCILTSWQLLDCLAKLNSSIVSAIRLSETPPFLRKWPLFQATRLSVERLLQFWLPLNGQVWPTSRL